MAYHLIRNYREAYGLFAVTGILFNHESPIRGETFVTRKITRAATRIALGLQEKLYLGNLDAIRDWGHAEDYVDAMHRMLHQDEPEDLIVATGQAHSVRDFLDATFGQLELDWRDHVEFDPRYLRPTEVEHLHGDATRAREKLGWAPRIGFEELVRRMVERDLELARQERTLRDAGHALSARLSGDA
jgi:GDPmannose 4,6-dehydratase